MAEDDLSARLTRRGARVLKLRTELQEEMAALKHDMTLAYKSGMSINQIKHMTGAAPETVRRTVGRRSRRV